MLQAVAARTVRGIFAGLPDCLAEVLRTLERGLLIFDGSLLHHPIKDMIANYSVTKEQAVEHILSLLASLGETERESSAHFLQTSSP